MASDCIKMAPAARREVSIISEKRQRHQGSIGQGQRRRWFTKSQRLSAGVQTRTRGGPFK